MSIAPREEKPALGLTFMAIGVLGFTCIDSSAKWLIAAGIPALQVVFCRYAFHLLLTIAVFGPKERMELFRTRHAGLLLLRSVLLVGSTMLNFLALRWLPITVTTTIAFAGPVVVTLLAIPLLKEKVGLHRISAICVGFSGVIVVMQPWGAAFHPAMLLSFGGLVCGSTYLIVTRMLAGKVGNATSQIWASGLPTLVLAPVVLPHWQTPDSATVGVMLIMVGIFGGGAHIAITAAHRLAPASLLAPMTYVQLLGAVVLGYLVFDTLPTLWTLAGAAIIIASGLYIWHRERRLGLPHPPKH